MTTRKIQYDNKKNARTSPLNFYLCGTKVQMILCDITLEYTSAYFVNENIRVL